MMNKTIKFFTKPDIYWPQFIGFWYSGVQLFTLMIFNLPLLIEPVIKSSDSFIKHFSFRSPPTVTIYTICTWIRKTICILVIFTIEKVFMNS
eukprot:UN25985